MIGALLCLSVGFNFLLVASVFYSVGRPSKPRDRAQSKDLHLLFVDATKARVDNKIIWTMIINVNGENKTYRKAALSSWYLLGGGESYHYGSEMFRALENLLLVGRITTDE